MGRNVTFSDVAVWHAPDVGDNRRDPEPFEVLIQPMSGEEFARFERATNADTLRGVAPGNAAASVAARIQAETERLVSERVLEVANYTLRIEVAGGAEQLVAPKTGAELVAALKRASASEYDLVFKIAAAIRDRSRLLEGARGNLRSPSAFGPAVTATPGAGAAGSAAARAPEGASCAPSATATAADPATTSLGSGPPSYAAAPGPSSASPTSSSSAGGWSGATSTSSRGEVVT